MILITLKNSVAIFTYTPAGSRNSADARLSTPEANAAVVTLALQADGDVGASLGEVHLTSGCPLAAGEPGSRICAAALRTPVPQV